MFRRYFLILLAGLAAVLVFSLSAAAQHSIWPTTAVPSIPDVGPDSPVELGVTFKADSSGYITGIRFYKSPANTGPHVGNLWTSTGTLLATVVFSGETASGWQQANFAAPVAITANTIYVASYHTTIGHWSADWNYFAAAGVNNPPLHALQNGSGTPDGRFAYGSASTFPTSSNNSANYWVDVVFDSGALQITTSQLPDANLAAAYSATLAATGGSTPYAWNLPRGYLPSGLVMSAGGTISGVPTAPGSYSFMVQVKDAVGNTSSKSLSINVVTNQPSITSQPKSQSVTPSQPATFSVSATGAAPLLYQWQKNGVAIASATAASYTTPPAISSDNGAQFRVTVSNAAGSVTSNAATLMVGAPLQITTSQLPNANLAGAYSATLAATGGSTPYTWSLPRGRLPSGLVMSTGGTISGVPTMAGYYSFLVLVNDTAGNASSGIFSINVVTPLPTVAITTPANGATVSGTISVTGTAADSVSITSVQVSIDSGSFLGVSGTKSWTFNLDTTSLSNAAHTLTAKAVDAAGSTALSSLLTFTVNNGTLATDCTLFASASGNDGNSGAAPSSPKTFAGAASVTQPGSVVCLLGGTYLMSSTFYPPNSGSPSSWIVYKSYGDGTVNLVWTAGAITQPMFKLGNDSFPSGAAYLEFRGLNLDGQNNALDGFFCHGGHHLRFIGNTINNTGGSGVGAVQCDYLTSDHNLINHNGYLYGWTSGISYNNNTWFDSYTGFHNIISNNIVAGEYDGSSNHTDGNGIILDLGSNTPPALIINNVVYGNGGRCIQSLENINFWIVNNTCYKNNLDPQLGTGVGDFVSQRSSNGYFINNIAVAWQTDNPPFSLVQNNSNVAFYANMYWGAAIDFTPSDPAQLIQADPLLVNPPYFDPTALGQYATALAPALLGNGLTLQSSSPAYNRGIDPSTLAGLPANIVSGLKQYIYVDINGKPRPQGGGCDLGAYQH